MRFPSREGWTRALTATLVAGGCVCAPACIRRDVSAEQPTTKSSYETVVPQPAIDKIDLLLVVDDSSSMGDKQKILNDALPNLVRGLVEPKCVDKKTRIAIPNVVADPTKPEAEQCPAGSEPAFTPVTDMHVGVISTSLGTYGTPNTCVRDGKALDDRAHLLARTESGEAVPEAGDVRFLSFYPDVEKNKDKVRHPDPPGPKLQTLSELTSALTKVVAGVGQRGCGIEAQLESAYRFLVQPDPWNDASVASGKAVLSGLDEELLRERAAFLRPDSLVAVVMLTDEEDASVDPLSFQGSGWRFLEPTPMKRATAACSSTPASAACTSCEFAASDPACLENGGKYTKAEDDLNVRFTSQTKRRFGVDPRFPLSRYVEGFTNPKVAQRSSEHGPSGNYNGYPDCTNPLFAARLPEKASDELCKLPRGPRSRDRVYFAIIGGVPHQLLPDDPTKAIDWTQLVGRDPDKLDLTGIDPHMIASTGPRADLPAPSAANDADPIHGREWTTNGQDLQYACTFDLPEPKACSGTEAERLACDCDGEKDTPLCKPGALGVQIKAKAYPTIRELLVARSLGEQGIPASLCPIQLTAPDREDYGYRPAVRRIVDRLERGRVGACVPRALERVDAEGGVSCVVAAILPDVGADAECSRFGLRPPSAVVVEQMRTKLRKEEGEEAAHHPICEIPQIPVEDGTSCRDEDSSISFCYVENVPGTCPHALVFTRPTERLVNARFTMQCIQLTTDVSQGP